MNYFGIRLKYLRTQDGITQAELGKALEIAKSTISMYESGKREPDFETIEKFADYFNVDMATFFPSGKIEKTAAPLVNGDSDLTSYLELLRTRPEMRALLDTAVGATKEEVEENVRFIEALRHAKKAD